VMLADVMDTIVIGMQIDRESVVDADAGVVGMQMDGEIVVEVGASDAVLQLWLPTSFAG
jgi:hypothetical protein